KAGELVVRANRRGGEARHVVRVLYELQPATAPRGALPLEADVLGDLEQPRALRTRHDASLQAAERIHERVLNRVLGLLTVREAAQAEPEDPPGVLLVQVGDTRFVAWKCANNVGES